MTKKKIMLTTIIMILAIAMTVGVTYAAWAEFTNKPTGDWQVSAKVPTDLTIGTTVADGKNYQGHDGGASDGYFYSTAVVEMTATRDLVIKGEAEVTITKKGVAITVDEGKVFIVSFLIGEAHKETLELTGKTLTTVTVAVKFPDLSNIKYQGCEFNILVKVSENK